MKLRDMEEYFLDTTDWVFLIPQIHLLNPDSKYDGIGRWDLCEVIRSWEGSPHSGVSGLNKETPESSFASSAMWAYSWKELSVNQEVAFTRYWICFDLGLPSLWTFEK